MPGSTSEWSPPSEVQCGDMELSGAQWSSVESSSSTETWSSGRSISPTCVSEVDGDTGYVV